MTAPDDEEIIEIIEDPDDPGNSGGSGDGNGDDDEIIEIIEDPDNPGGSGDSGGSGDGDDGGEVIVIIDPDDPDYPGGDDPIIVPDDFFEEEIEEDGNATLIRRKFAQTAGVDESTRSYTEINGGIITFGYRNVDSGVRNPAYTLQPDRLSSGGTTYLGLSCNAARIKIAQDSLEDESMMSIRVGSSYPPCGFMQCITAIQKVNYGGDKGIDWTVENLPFVYGLCVAQR